MNRTDHKANTPSPQPGLFATLRALLRGRESSTSSSPRSAARRTPLGLFVLAFALTVTSLVPAIATAAEETTPPEFLSHLSAEQVNATHALVGIANGSNIRPGGLDTAWRLEYSGAESGPWTLIASGTCQAQNLSTCGNQDSAIPQITVHHLTPHHTYYARAVAENALGRDQQQIEFTTTAIAPPEVPSRICEKARHGYTSPICNIPHTTSIDLEPQIESNGAETTYVIESAAAKGGPFAPVPGGSGSVTTAQDFADPAVTLTGLTPEITYYLRVTATNEKGTAVSEEIHALTASIHPLAASVGTTGVAANSAHVLGVVRPQTFETDWRFEYAPAEADGSAPVSASPAWTTPPAAEGVISTAEADEESHKVQADLTGLQPATAYYVRLFAENEPEPGVTYTSTAEPAPFETAGPPLAETFATHAIDGESMRAIGSVEPHGYETHYYFQYVTQERFKATAWAEAESTPELELDPGVRKGFEGRFEGYETKILGADLSGLSPGTTYDYRILATSTSPGNPVIPGAPQTLTVPTPAPEEAQAPCPNQALRTGPSADLPDCRAYEQLTPADKEGAQELFHYGGGINATALVGEDGDHLALETNVTAWGSGPRAGQAPYLFSRTPAGWRLTATSLQPETGVSQLDAGLFEPDLGQIAFRSGYQTSSGGGESPNLEYRAGPPGGPYATVASVPRAQVGSGGGWVAASADFSKLILQVEDRKLVNPQITTKSGSDLYEYTAQAGLRQVNLGLGTCGAQIVRGLESGEGEASSAHAVSADGSRVFFEAVPGSNCSEPTHLFVRVDGAETRDLGPYRFLAANPAGTELLLEKHLGETHEIFLYEVEAAALKPLFSTRDPNTPIEAVVSSDFTAIYLYSTQQLTAEAPPPSPGVFDSKDLYRYDLSTETLRFLVQVSQAPLPHLSPDGRYAYLDSSHAGLPALPGGGIEPGVLENGQPVHSPQVYRYDSAQGVIQCLSCASPFDPEPRLRSFFGARPFEGRTRSLDGQPELTFASADGGFAFFSTPAALLPSDVDGELRPEFGNPSGANEYSSLGGETSPSSDIYEWRRNGLDGCRRIQGCLALITDGRGGLQNLLLGSTPSGRDVFISTRSQLGPSDDDTAGDIYDVRIGGGIPPAPPRPVECEGDACSHPVPAPNDPTPSSESFHGAGNEHPAKGGKGKGKKHPHKKHHKAKKHHQRAAGHNHGGGK